MGAHHNNILLKSLRGCSNESFYAFLTVIKGNHSVVTFDIIVIS